MNTAARPDADRVAIPANSIIFGYGPMLPLVAAAIGAWTLPYPWPAIATELAIIWGAIIIVFVGGVRRGFGFGRDTASTASEIATMLAYFIPGGLALVLMIMPAFDWALGLLSVGFVLVPLLDRRAAFAGNAPAHFARLRPPQMSIAVISLVALLAHLLVG